MLDWYKSRKYRKGVAAPTTYGMAAWTGNTPLRDNWPFCRHGTAKPTGWIPAMILMEYGYGCDNRSPASSRPPLRVTVASAPVETVPNHVHHVLRHAARRATVAGKVDVTPLEKPMPSTYGNRVPYRTPSRIMAGLIRKGPPGRRGIPPRQSGTGTTIAAAARKETWTRNSRN